MDLMHYAPVPTCEIPMPILEERSLPEASPLPRILRQAAGVRSATRRVVLLTALFLGAAALEAALLVRLPAPEPIVVYQDLPRHLLLEPAK